MLDVNLIPATGLQLRRATQADQSELEDLRQISLDRLLAPLLRRQQLPALYEHTQLDPCLVQDGTYYVVEVDGRIAASGGWSRRAALFGSAGGNAPQGRPLDTSRDAVAVRAMYTHPDFTRIGLGSILLATSETAARLAGFRRAELLATPTGRELYLARGWRDVKPITLGPDDGSGIDASLMERAL
jgi:GNAT superfamily N-acetyltransferase